jgi:streptomycin 6-kinase
VSEPASRALDLPVNFIRHNEQDPAWLRALPDLLARLAARWSLALDRYFPEIRINYVAPATRADGTPCVLKVSRHVDETRNEIAALRFWDGNGAARLLEADPDIGALLVERLDPGTMLVEVADSDDDAATVIAAEVLRRLWRPVHEPNELRTLDSWCDAYDRNREALSRGTDGFPAAMFQRADAMRRDLLASTETPTVLHGDLHHFNVLRARRAPWMAIDPKGLVGDRCFDVCQFFRNPRDVPTRVNRRRLDLFCAELGLDRARTNAWCFVHAVLDACWDFEDGNSWEHTIAYAEETLSF